MDVADPAQNMSALLNWGVYGSCAIQTARLECMHLPWVVQGSGDRMACFCSGGVGLGMER